MQEACSTAAKNLEDLSGIRNVVATHDDKMLHIQLSFQFNSIKALNKAMCQLYAYIAASPKCTYVKMDRHSFTREDAPNITQLLAHYRTKPDAQIENFILKKILTVVTYNMTYSFDKKIKSATNKLGSISEDRKTFFLKHLLFDECEQALSWSNKIVFWTLGINRYNWTT